MYKHLIENCVVIKQTEKAILVESTDFEEPEWIPQSQIHEDSDVWKDRQKGDLIVKMWFAEKKGWV